MICQNCQAIVDNDLIFCTNCGERLSETKSESQTVLLKDSVVTKTSIEQSPKPSSNLKWVALIVALLAIPASIFGIYLLMNSNNQQVSQNTNKLNKPVASPPRKSNPTQNLNVNLSNENNNSTYTNANEITANANSSNTITKIEVMNERIEIAPKEHYTVPFEVEKANVKLIGEAKLLEGEKIAGFVYLQKSYDEYFPDPTYKMFSFEGRKTAEIKASLVEEKYVLIFVNDTDKPMIIQGNFSLE